MNLKHVIDEHFNPDGRLDAADVDELARHEDVVRSIVKNRLTQQNGDTACPLPQPSVPDGCTES